MYILISILRLNLVLTYGIPPDFRRGVQMLQLQWCRVAIICGTVGFFIPFHFVITLEAPLDVKEEAACDSQGEEDGPPRTGDSIDSLSRLMLWGI